MSHEIPLGLLLYVAFNYHKLLIVLIICYTTCPMFNVQPHSRHYWNGYFNAYDASGLRLSSLKAETTCQCLSCVKQSVTPLRI
ncbi:CLUMA_CG009744, isoform A [Clunio marinus]|uniref:CLUMA_CG009744, isoform A n=1 Tax=Clunio marinus TaxID=568069 RepID=A0A1J1I7Q8_9DIPT|nr:CLUMA_CG009744, isoform A [Clunio marinus]